MSAFGGKADVTRYKLCNKTNIFIAAARAEPFGVTLSSRKDFAKLRPHFRSLGGSRKTKESLEI
jgi:hypothetical protein